MKLSVLASRLNPSSLRAATTIVASAIVVVVVVAAADKPKPSFVEAQLPQSFVGAKMPPFSWLQFEHLEILKLSG